MSACAPTQVALFKVAALWAFVFIVVRSAGVAQSVTNPTGKWLANGPRRAGLHDRTQFDTSK